MNEKIIEIAVEAAAKHVPTRGMSVASGVTCGCGYWTGSEKPGITRPVGVRSGSDGLDWHRATVMLAEVTPTIKAQALREAADWLDREARAAGVLEPDVEGLDAFQLRSRADLVEVGEYE